MAYLTAEKKQELFGQYGKSNTDTGSPESQIALFSYRISHLTEHMKSNRHDFGTQRALLRLVGKRRETGEKSSVQHNFHPFRGKNTIFPPI